MGLALARSLTQLHKGNLYLKEQSNELNTFVVSLPLTGTGNSAGAGEPNDNTQFSVTQ
ncbi:hypothetical protein [Paraflavitalea speifideaquila]|uniref:hypothetical protein n=1 Tax=Paraflavitalea speifideaquila TaxID=3076558 RepID=UPI00331305F1